VPWGRFELPAHLLFSKAQQIHSKIEEKSVIDRAIFPGERNEAKKYSPIKEHPALRLVRVKAENPEARSWFSSRTLITNFRHCKCPDPRDKKGYP